MPPSDYDIERWFSYHRPDAHRIDAHEAVRKAGAVLARAMAKFCPPGYELEMAVLRVREAVALANAAIACKEDNDAK